MNTTIDDTVNPTVQSTVESDINRRLYILLEQYQQDRLKRFHLYVLSFYCSTSDLYPEYAVTLDEVQQATSQHINTGFDFAYDSVDREHILEIILANRCDNHS